VIEAGVAAGHPATAEAGAAILRSGGSAADAAVAACLASCVAETVMTGLLGGGHAVYYDSSSGCAALLDCFVNVPSGGGAPLEELAVPFGEELVRYAIGAASCAVPGVPAGLDLLWRSYGRLPWTEVVEPALQLARDGVALPPAHAACLEMLEPVFTLREGGRIYAPGGRLLAAGDRLEQPGLVAALELLRDEGAASVYTGSIATNLLDLVSERGGTIMPGDLAAYAPAWNEPVEVAFAGRRILTRGGLSGVPAALGRLPLGSRGRGLLAALRGEGRAGHTTNLCVVDGEGSACVLTTSLGLGSGDWLPGLDLHLNSMLGEADLLHGDTTPGARMGSMMAPTLAFGPGGSLELAAGAAGGTRLRTALVGCLQGILDEGLEPQAAVDRPRFHPAAGIVHAEPGADPELLAALEATGVPVRRWRARHHYFGGVSALGCDGGAADPRRSGAVARL
jgi:gamma-glutamyltranspeptidase / glutathione hydrolase